MAEKEKLENQLYERMLQENKEFIDDLKTKPAEDVIHSAYEIACRDNLLMLFEDETSLPPGSLKRCWSLSIRLRSFTTTGSNGMLMRWIISGTA